MLNQPSPQARVDLFGLFSTKLLRVIRQLMVEHAHAEVVVSIKDGKIVFVRANRTYLPDNLPEV